MDADESLLDLLFDQLADDAVPDDVIELILAAYTGDDQLRAALDGQSVTLPTREDVQRRRPDPLYLDGVTVAGFRGVGPAAALRLTPSPGLTLVVGRNGSGKSSFAEAVELALTGDSARWAERNSVFRDGWRNLHQGSPCQIELTLRADGCPGPLRVRRSWRDDDTDPGQATTTITAGGQRHQDVASLGWGQPLETYRPFLTANDLGRLISATPSGLFDALAPILGIDPVVEADKRLMRLRKDLDERVSAVKKTRETLHAMLATLDDERARAAAAIIAKRRPDLAALDTLLAGAEDDATDPAAAACRQLTAATLPEIEDVARAADELQTAAQAVSVVAATRTGTAERLLHLLDAAMRYHDTHGDGPCPVCHTGALDTSWRETTTAELSRLRADTAAAQEAARRLNDTRSHALTLLGLGKTIPETAVAQAAGVPEELRQRLREALQTWQTTPPNPTPEQLAQHLATAYPPLHAALAAVREAASDWLRQRHDAWREQAAALHTWLTQARAAVADEAALNRIKTARNWLKRATDTLRAARLEPFAEQSQHIWEQLRQESNVELSGMRLDGASTRRRVAFPATVDGTATSAMAVMSQGELQALGLAVFLPRACAPDSPFRFLIIDDPVQSMDPSKVDGLAQVLAELAEQRQIVVFTHDNRLPEAVRRLRIAATVWEVTRRDGSIVEIRKNADPVARHLADAGSLMHADELPDNVRYPLVSGFCRSALEAACHERIRRERIGRGERHADVEILIEQAHTLSMVAALALFGDTSAGGEVMTRINRYGRWAGDAFQACKRGVHGAGSVDLPVLVQDTRRLAEALR